MDFLCRDVVRSSIEASGIYRRLPRFEALIAACAPPPAASPGAAPADAAPPEAVTKPASDPPDQAVQPGQPASTTPQPREDAAEARPANYQELPKWVEAAFPDRLVLSAKAQRAVKASTYHDVGTVCDALELLALHYVDMRRNGGREQFEQSLQALRLKDEAIAANPDRLRKDPQYWCKHEGRPVFVDRHLKKGNSREPRECLRIYYAWDEDARKVVVGHLTTHLASEIS